MIEEIFTFIASHAAEAPYFFFFLILIGGLNIPISEDVVVLTAGAFVATYLPNDYLFMYAFIFAGSLLAAWTSYALGHIFGPALLNIKWFNRFLPEERVATIREYLEKYGFGTFIVGRFLPGGIRNGLFMTSGLSGMTFQKFVFRDTPACLLSTSVIFYLGYLFGENRELLIATFQKISIWLLLAISIGIAFTYWRRR